MDDQQKEIHAVTKKYEELIEKAQKYGFETVELYKKMHTEIAEIKEGDEGADIFGMSPEDWEQLEKDFKGISMIANNAKD